jgi:hypothetical protein
VYVGEAIAIVTASKMILTPKQATGTSLVPAGFLLIRLANAG